jgi:hypothetical protein
MTSNQINYAKLMEDQRHNIVSEGQSGMANMIAQMNAETNRMNAETNAYTARTRAAELAETARANRANELLVAQRNAETARYQQESNRIAHENTYVTRTYNENYLALQGRNAELQSGTAQRNTDVQTRASIVNNLGNMLGGVLRLAFH